jgi:hypothetical protein
MADKYWNGNAGTDGDVTDATNWTPSGVPTASDNVRLIAAFDTAMSSNLDGLTGVSLGDFIVEEGYSGTIGSSTADLEITCSSFEFNGSGVAYIDLEASNITATVHNSAAAASVGAFGLYLIGSNLADLVVAGGSVSLASVMGTTATAAAVHVSGGSVSLGSGCTLTTITAYGGNTTIRANVTNVNGYGGTIATKEQAAITTLLLDGATLNDGSTGTTTTATVNSGSLQVKAGTSKTISTLNINAGGAANWDPNSVTVSTVALGGDNVPIKINSSRG